MPKVKSVIEAVLPYEEIKNISLDRTFKSKKGKVFVPVKIVTFDKADDYGNDTVINFQQSKEEIKSKKYTRLCNGKTVYPKPETQESEDMGNTSYSDNKPSDPIADLPF